MSKAFLRAVFAAAMMASLVACQTSPANTSLASNSLASVPENQPYFRTCRGHWGFGNAVAMRLEIYGKSAVLFVAQTMPGADQAHLSIAQMNRWAATDNIYQPVRLGRSDRHFTYNLEPINGGDSFVATADDRSLQYSVDTHWPNIPLTCGPEGSKRMADKGGAVSRP